MHVAEWLAIPLICESAKLLPAFLALLTRMSLAFRDPRPRAKVERLALGLLCAEGPKTITSALGWLEQRYEDWSGEYRLLSQAQWSPSDFFTPVLEAAVGFATDPSAPLYVAHDDTLLRKTPKAQRRGAQKYGPPLPTPEESLRDESVPWQQIEVFVAQKLHRLKFKVIDAVCWPKATADQPLRLIILKPAGYRLRKGSKLLYRRPAYLICTTTDVTLNYLINAYLARWEIEVNFHDEKSILLALRLSSEKNGKYSISFPNLEKFVIRIVHERDFSRAAGGRPATDRVGLQPSGARSGRREADRRLQDARSRQHSRSGRLRGARVRREQGPGGQSEDSVMRRESFVAYGGPPPAE